MPDRMKALRVLADPTRLRMLRLLEAEELTVAELQEILGMGQSRISSQLAQLRAGGLATDRRAGKNTFYRLAQPDGFTRQLLDLAAEAAADLPECTSDDAALDLVRSKRTDRARAYFDALAGRFGRTYCPGRSWKALAEALLKAMPAQDIADLGAGEGTLSQLLAQRARKVIAVDNSERMVAYGTRIARENGFTNLEYRLGDIEAPPIEPGSVDLVIFSQALHHARRPERAMRAAFEMLRIGGRILVLDLLQHSFEDARELYQDVWLGFSESDLLRLMREAGFTEIEVAVVDREAEPARFATLLGVGSRPDPES